MFQQVILIGNLGRDPEMRYTPDGTPVTNFSIATNERWTDQAGEPQERTVWFRISAWNRLAEVCNQYLEKGRQVMVVGILRADPETGGPRIFERNDGSAGSSFEITARRVVFLGSRGNGEGSTDNEPGQSEGDEDEARIPF